MIRVAIAAPPQDECRVAAFDGAVVVGRDPRCDLALPGRGVSSSHCRLSAMPGLAGAFMVEDLGSTYGTYVNGQRVGKPVIVSERDVITVGSVRLVVVGGAGDDAALERVRSADTPAKPTPPVEVPTPTRGLADFDANAPWPRQFAHFDAIARAWHDASRARGSLLRGAAIRIAERWLDAGTHRDPAPDALHREFITASRRAASRRTRAIALAVGGAATIGLGIAGWIAVAPHVDEVWVDPPEIVDAGEPPPAAASDSDTPEPPPELDVPALLDRTLGMEDARARLLLQSGIAEAVRSRGGPPLGPAGWPVHAAAQRTFAELHETILDGHEQGITSTSFGAAGQWIVSSSADGSARVWDLFAPASVQAVSLRGHLGPVHAAAITPDGRFAVTVGDDATVRRWDLSAADPGATGRVLRKHRAPVTHVAFHPAGRFAVTGDDNGTLVGWDLEAEDPEATAFEQVAHDAVVTDLVFDRSDPPSLYSASDDRLVRRWRVDADGMRGVQKLQAHTGGVTAVAVSDDARFIASAGTDGEVWLWDRAPKGAGKVPLAGHTESVNDLAFTPDGELLVTGSDDDTVRVWEVRAADPGLAHVKLEGHTGDITSVAIAAGGKRAVSAGLDNTVRVWDLTKKDRVVDQTMLAGHVAKVTAIDVAPDGHSIVSGSDDGTVRLWDGLSRGKGRGGKVLRLGAGQVLDMDVTAQGDQVMAVGADGRAALWDLRDEARVPRPRLLPGLTGLVTATAFDPRGRFVAAGGEGGEIQLFSLADPSAAPRTLSGHEASVNAIAFTPEGDRLLSVSSDRTVRSWPVDSGDPSVWTGHADEVHVLAVSPRGEFAFTGGLDRMVIRWDLRGEGTPVQLVGHEAEVLDIAVSPDGRFVATASADRRARVWDAATGQLAHILRRHDEPVAALAFSPRDKLATAGHDRSIFVWDLASAHPDEAPRVLGGHEQSVTTLAFVADGSILVSGSNDATVRLWRIDDGDSTILRGHDSVVARVRITADGRYAVSASYDGTLRLWPLDHDRLVALACDVVGRPLSASDWAAFFGNRAPARTCADPP